MTRQARLAGVSEAVRVLRSPAALVALVALTAQIALLFAYLVATETAVTSTARLLVPFVWITLGIWLVGYLAMNGRTPGTPPTGRRRLLAFGVGVGYMLVLSAIAGLVGVTGGARSLNVVAATPGWGPVLVASVPPLSLVVVPYEGISYLALSYAVYRATLSAPRGVVAGLTGLFSCVSCTLPVVGAVVSAAGGTTVALQSGSSTIPLATLVFAVTVALLAWTVPTEPTT